MFFEFILSNMLFVFFIVVEYFRVEDEKESLIKNLFVCFLIIGLGEDFFYFVYLFIYEGELGF